jgi:plastocyanin
MRRSVIAVIVIIIILAVAGFIVRGNKSDTSTNNSQTSTNNTQPKSNSTSNSQNSNNQSSANTVSIANMAFTPPQITVNKGDSVTWTNNDSMTHTVVDDLSNVGGPNSGDIAPGSSYSFTFTKTGSFQYHCSIHPSMRGTIVVK